MPVSSVLQVRVEENLKKRAEQLFEEMGLDLPSAIRLFLKQSLLHNGIPFAVSGADGFYSPQNQRVLEASIRQLESGRTVSRSTAELEALARD